MKTPLSSLLLTIIVLIQFSEINSSGFSGEGSSRQSSRMHSPISVKIENEESPARGPRSRSSSPVQLERQYPHGPTWHGHNPFVFYVDQKSSPESHSHRQSLSLSKVEKLVVTFMGKEIQISFTRSRHQTIPLDCKILGPNAGVPTIEYRRNHNYVTQAIYINDLRCVVYVTPHEVALGAKLPPTANTVLPQGDPSLLSPDHTKWYITYEGLDYEVTEDPVSGEQLDIKLLPHDVRPDAAYIRRHRVKMEPIFYSGLFFIRFRNNNNIIVGAELDHIWRERPEYAEILPTVDALIEEYKRNFQ